MLGTPTLFHFMGKLTIEAFSLQLGVLQVADQCLVVKPLQQAALHQPIDLPGHHQQGQQQNTAEHTPALLQRMLAEQQIAHRRQQAGQSKTEEGGKTDGIGHAG